MKQKSKNKKRKKEEIKAIIFDIGGILVNEDTRDLYPKLSKLMNFDLDKFYKIRKKHYHLAATGKISSDDYLRIFIKKLGIKNFKKFKQNWVRIRREAARKDKNVEKIIIKLKKNYAVGTLTNIIPMHHRIRVELKAYDHFKIKLISFKEGTIKPNIKIYKLLIKKLRINPEKIIFVDDQLINLKPAKKLGIKTIFFKNHKQLVKDLKKLGVKI